MRKKHTDTRLETQRSRDLVIPSRPLFLLSATAFSTRRGVGLVVGIGGLLEVCSRVCSLLIACREFSFYSVYVTSRKKFEFRNNNTRKKKFQYEARVAMVSSPCHPLLSFLAVATTAAYNKTFVS